eukprot:CAMPEP_0203984018 /NCGR_PEP_ID=MMETSP0360-20130528/4195_1 /ASSEMBLY_ACC=CAM_ASM_000342 /TAXON_ID=268821 /ORGANISM="Scrippsiella Hangoei, Strain SHTV-5" /LENGTH=39 /DNA_ID= /DNA_START= /DNA_END= /DNA_ORIENTATION=
MHKNIERPRTTTLALTAASHPAQTKEEEATRLGKPRLKL